MLLQSLSLVCDWLWSKEAIIRDSIINVGIDYVLALVVIMDVVIIDVVF
jgi:hypothetical protein